MRIALFSDTHGYFDPEWEAMLHNVDEIWHAGDVGNVELLLHWKTIAPVYGVYGNIDGQEIRHILPEELWIERFGYRIFMRHIGGYPPKYTGYLNTIFQKQRPDIFICGHSHILKVINDKKRKILHLNPGAAGNHGFHKERTMLLFSLSENGPSDMQLVTSQRG